MKNFLFITDLDASLLWHDYSYEEAKPALKKLRDLQIPLILNSSKTLSELQTFANEIQSDAPIIAENGGAVCIHKKGSLAVPAEAINEGEYGIIHSGLSRESVLREAHSLRVQHKYKFEGFSDWSAQQLTEKTKLDLASAERAKLRYVTEPILWTDTEDRFEQFNDQLKQQQIKTIRGGTFIHLMGEVDKADGAKMATDLFIEQFPEKSWTIVAIGDSENDLQMLEQADIAVVIPHRGEIRIRPNNKETIYAEKEAAQGWANSVEKILSS